MSDQVYQKLREQLDHYSIGFPATESGVEIKILEKLFFPEEAAMFLDLSMMLETPEAVAQRTGRDAAQTAEMLGTMFDKGLVFRVKREGPAKYAAVPFVVGIYEFQLPTMDKEFSQLMEDYFRDGYGPQLSDSKPPMRTVPVGQSVDANMLVAPYDDVRQLFEDRDVIALAKCICRVQSGILERSCQKPLDVCFTFGSHARYYLDKNMAREITKDEALAVIDKCEESGLVPQPFYSQDSGGLCNCCGDCCGLLRSLNEQSRPADLVTSNYFAQVDAEECVACEVCLERCQMDAVTIGPDDVAVVDLARCIGCGLCVTTCATEAMSLELKPEDQRIVPPKTGQETMMLWARKRGKSLVPQSMLK